MLCTVLMGCQSPNQILFSSGRNGNSDLFLMDSDGRNIKQLTNSPFEEWAPTIINDTEISFLRQEGKDVKRYKIDLRTKLETRLNHPSNCILDDKNIIYGPISGRQLFQCKGDIFLADKNGERIQNLTEDLPGQSFKADWFPDESKIVFSNNSTGNSEIYSFNFASKALINLTNNPAMDEGAGISPDGEKMLFSSGREGNQNMELFLMDLETGELTNITNTPDWELIGRWSYDGKWIFFGSNKDGNWELYRYELKTKKTQRLTYSEAFDGDPRVLRKK